MISVEAARPNERDHIQRISGKVFSDLGEFQNLPHRVFSVQGVQTFLARCNAEVIGFAMLGFFPWNQGSDEVADGWVAELLAVAVEPEFQNQGAGDGLWQQANTLIKRMRERRSVYEIQVICPQIAHAALRFFHKRGFVQRDGWVRSYSNGQKAVRLVKPIEGLPFF